MSRSKVDLGKPLRRGFNDPDRGTGRTHRAIRRHMHRLAAGDVAVFVAPYTQQLSYLKTMARSIYDSGDIKWSAFTSVVDRKVAQSIVVASRFPMHIRGLGVVEQNIEIDHAVWELCAWEEIRAMEQAIEIYCRP